MVAINDAYFDVVYYPLQKINRKDVVNISIGDGSPAAIARIRHNNFQQTATIAEPVQLQAWQLVDDIGRSFNKKKASNFQSLPILIDYDVLKKIEHK